MGRQDRPSVQPSGPMIFYGRKHKSAKPKGSSKAKQLSQPSISQRTVPSTQHRPSIPSNNKPSPITHSPRGDTLASELYNKASIGISVSPLPAKSNLNGNPGAAISTATLHSNAETITALIKTIVDVFQSAPYIEVIAGVVQQIIQIADVSFHAAPVRYTLTHFDNRMFKRTRIEVWSLSIKSPITPVLFLRLSEALKLVQEMC